MRTTTALLLTAAALAMALAGCGPAAHRVPVPASSRAVSELVPPTGQTSPFVTEANFVMNWLVLGPISFGDKGFSGDQQQSSIDHVFVKDEARLNGTQPAPAGASWQEKQFKGSVQAGQIDLDALYGEPEHAVAYAVAWLKCPAEVKDAKLYVGSDDYIRIWINGKVVHTYKEARRAANQDQDVAADIHLREGYNHIVVKCVDVVQAWDFYLRLTDANDRPMTVKPVAPAK